MVEKIPRQGRLMYVWPRTVTTLKDLAPAKICLPYGPWLRVATTHIFIHSLHAFQSVD